MQIYWSPTPLYRWHMSGFIIRFTNIIVHNKTGNGCSSIDCKICTGCCKPLIIANLLTEHNRKQVNYNSEKGKKLMHTQCHRAAHSQKHQNHTSHRTMDAPKTAATMQNDVLVKHTQRHPTRSTQTHTQHTRSMCMWICGSPSRSRFWHCLLINVQCEA